MHARMLSSTASGVVKSRTTLILLRRSGVKAEALGFSLPVSTETSWPRSRAISTTSEPVLPRPRTKIFMARKDFNRKGRREGPKDRKANRVAGSLLDLCAAVALFLGERRMSEVGCLWRLGKHFHIQIGKEVLCNRRTTSSTTSSSTTNVKLISDAPWEIMRIFT